jgi:hypothetical protein
MFPESSALLPYFNRAIHHEFHDSPDLSFLINACLIEFASDQRFLALLMTNHPSISLPVIVHTDSHWAYTAQLVSLHLSGCESVHYRAQLSFYSFSPDKTLPSRLIEQSVLNSTGEITYFISDILPDNQTTTFTITEEPGAFVLVYILMLSIPEQGIYQVKRDGLAVTYAPAKPNTAACFVVSVTSGSAEFAFCPADQSRGAPPLVSLRFPRALHPAEAPVTVANPQLFTVSPAVLANLP